MAKTYTVNDGKLVLILEECEEGGYVVRSPMDPELITEAETVKEAFAMARDALKGLRRMRMDMAKQEVMTEIVRRRRTRAKA